MAFFERTDERDHMIACSICNKECSERGISGHRSKCKPKNAEKFQREHLFTCCYDSSHIVKKGQLDDHYEFCTKRQSKLVEEFQILSRAAARQEAGLPVSDPEPQSEFVPMPKIRSSELDEEDWNRQADENPFEFKFSKLRLN